MMKHPPADNDSGFTLVELMIVVVILAILAAMAIPSYNDMSTEAKQTAFASELLIMVEAAERYRAKTESYLTDGSSGVFVPELTDYIDQGQFEGGTPLGGVWDTEAGSFGVTSAIGAHFNGSDIPSDTIMSGVDVQLDDGNLAAGAFRKLAGDRFYYVIAE